MEFLVSSGIEQIFEVTQNIEWLGRWNIIGIIAVIGMIFFAYITVSFLIIIGSIISIILGLFTIHNVKINKKELESNHTILSGALEGLKKANERIAECLYNLTGKIGELKKKPDEG